MFPLHSLKTSLRADLTVNGMLVIGAPLAAVEASTTASPVGPRQAKRWQVARLHQDRGMALVVGGERGMKPAVGGERGTRSTVGGKRSQVSGGARGMIALDSVVSMLAPASNPSAKLSVCIAANSNSRRFAGCEGDETPPGAGS
jgi:hypothetical protein